MKKFVLFLFAGVLVLLAACNKKETPVNGVNVDLSVGLSYVDQNGNDLLSPDNPQAYKLNDFRLYYMKNGKKTLYFMSNYDDPYGYTKAWYYPVSGLYRFDMAFPADSCTLLQLSDGTVDTFKINVLRKGGNQLVQKIWINDSLVWQTSSLTEHYIVVKKKAQ